MDIYITEKWHDPALRFEHLSPCKGNLSLNHQVLHTLTIGRNLTNCAQQFTCPNVKLWKMDECFYLRELQLCISGFGSAVDPKQLFHQQ